MPLEVTDNFRRNNEGSLPWVEGGEVLSGDLSGQRIPGRGP